MPMSRRDAVEQVSDGSHMAGLEAPRDLDVLEAELAADPPPIGMAGLGAEPTRGKSRSWRRRTAPKSCSMVYRCG